MTNKPKYQPGEQVLIKGRIPVTVVKIGATGMVHVGFQTGETFPVKTYEITRRCKPIVEVTVYRDDLGWGISITRHNGRFAHWVLDDVKAARVLKAMSNWRILSAYPDHSEIGGSGVCVLYERIKGI